MLVRGTNWTTRHFMVCQQSCNSSHKMDSDMWQFIHSSHKWLLTKIVMCETRLNIVDWVCSKFMTLLATLKTLNQHQGEYYVSLENICSHRLVVQEANVSVSQFHRIGNYFVGCGFANGWYPCSWPFRCGERSVTFLEKHPSSSGWSLSKRKRSMMKCREVKHAMKSKAPTTAPKRKDTVAEKWMNRLWTTLWQAQQPFHLYIWRRWRCDQNGL